jgi:zinc transporter ZupT
MLEALMRRLALTGLLVLLGFAFGASVVEANHMLGGSMGAVLGAVAAVMVFAFPRDFGPEADRDSWFRD